MQNAVPAIQEAGGASEVSQHDVVVATVVVEGAEDRQQGGEHVRGRDAYGIEGLFAAGVVDAVVVVDQQAQTGLFADGGVQAGVEDVQVGLDWFDVAFDGCEFALDGGLFLSA